MEKEIKCEQIGRLKGAMDMPNRIYSVEGLSPTIRTMQGGNLEPKILEEDPKVWDGFNGCVKADSTVTGTITRNCGNDLKRNGIGIIEKAVCVGGVGEKKSNGGTQYYQQDRIYDGDVALAHPANLPGGSYMYVDPNQVRVRKLTPRECWRLMGVKDEDFDKVAKNQSNSSLYHLAGDSIITNVLQAIFKEMM